MNTLVPVDAQQDGGMNGKPRSPKESGQVINHQYTLVLVLLASIRWQVGKKNR